MEILDCKGLDCPKPVLKTKNFIESNPNVQAFIVLVDNEAASQNVARFCKTQGLDVSVQEEGGDFKVQVTRSGEAAGGPVVEEPEVCSTEEKTLILISKNTVGSGDDVLGSALMFNFLDTLDEMGEALWRLVFLNSGVKLTIEGAKTLSSIQRLERQGVSVLVCGTCLTHFNLLDKKRVGETTNMLDIVTSMQLADKVITI